MVLFKKDETETDEFQLLQKELGILELAKQVHSNIEAELKKLEEVIKDLTQPVIYTEGNNVEYLHCAKQYFDPLGNYLIKDGGGKDDLRNLYNHLLKNAPKHKVVFVWDPDYEKGKNLTANDAILPLVLKENKGNPIGGIESLFHARWFTDDLYSTKSGNLPGESMRLLNKKKFLDKVKSSALKDDFLSFALPLKEISKFLK